MRNSQPWFVVLARLPTGDRCNHRSDCAADILDGIGFRELLAAFMAAGECSYMRPPGPYTTNQYDPTRITNIVSRARPNFRYSALWVGLINTVRTRMTAKIAKAIVPVIITVLSMIALSIAAHISGQRLPQLEEPAGR